jgi:hypothetical protein
MDRNQQLEVAVAALQAHVQQQQQQIAALTTRRNPIRNRSLGTILGLCLALMLGTIALAAIPGANGVITGCYRPETGRLRVIDAQTSKKCERGESQITWNQTGPAGPKGNTGAPGAQGIPGAAGAKGDPGPQGAPGAKGDTGPQGIPGAQGPAGAIGPQGDTGPQGPAGAIGPQGDTGPQGLPGAIGPKGSAGTPGISGYQIVSDVTQFDSSAAKQFDVRCPAGKQVIGGGAQIFPSLADPNRNTAPVVLRTSIPTSGGGEGWAAEALETSAYTFQWDLTVYAICANVAP